VLRNDSRFQLEEIFFESVHPTATGHAFLAQLLGHMLLSARAAADGACAASACAPIEAPLPVAFFDANRVWADSTPPEARCVMGDELAEWVAGGDWQYVVEGNARRKQRPKPGWVSSGAPNSTIELCRPIDRLSRAAAALRTPPDTTRAAWIRLAHLPRAVHAVWKIAHLQSYTADMGSVELGCMGDCACEPRTLRGWLPSVTGEPPPRVSMVVTTILRVKQRRMAGGDATRGCGCLIRMRLVNPSDGAAPYHANKQKRRHRQSGAVKFKLVGLAVMDGDDNSFARNAVFHVEPGWQSGGVAVMGY
jgi:hypothetical protein